MSEITFNGLASGLDTASIISALVQVAKQPITQLESKKTSINTKLSVLSDLSSRLGSLRTAALALDTSKEVRSFAASSSDTTTLTAAATSSAAPGTYPVVVQRLAAAQRSYSNTVASSDGLNQVGSGTLGIQVGSGTWKTITSTRARRPCRASPPRSMAPTRGSPPRW